MKILLAIMAVLMLSACQGIDLTQNENYVNEIPNPSLSCTRYSSNFGTAHKYDGCWYAFQENNQNLTDPIQIELHGWDRDYLDYQVGTSHTNNFNTAISKSIAEGQILKTFIPIGRYVVAGYTNGDTPTVISGVNLPLGTQMQILNAAGTGVLLIPIQDGLFATVDYQAFGASYSGTKWMRYD